uniref:Uncharacterized protein n=1 Tax=Chromera velia CCMP2878 TaxID=1169474 RepID=A0A0G4HIZ5_9ALVE|eukprot:Cvel_7008.t1-p1 / transcript=Cvel_7008.t1 / gene=Cvel_7008 / organism=Chromera_velia_CCMP2878 / gene_product=hypothetical protein / transcript_product=hypothetical protein / location=Cvel_scaffold357:3075-5424(-) / protein_length=501 / sequence_SO=supercontig / SO=protein_coding / is_pseudo=false
MLYVLLLLLLAGRTFGENFCADADDVPPPGYFYTLGGVAKYPEYYPAPTKPASPPLRGPLKNLKCRKERNSAAASLRRRDGDSKSEASSKAAAEKSKYDGEITKLKYDLASLQAEAAAQEVATLKTTLATKEQELTSIRLAASAKEKEVSDLKASLAKSEASSKAAAATLAEMEQKLSPYVFSYAQALSAGDSALLIFKKVYAAAVEKIPQDKIQLHIDEALVTVDGPYTLRAKPRIDTHVLPLVQKGYPAGLLLHGHAVATCMGFGAFHSERLSTSAQKSIMQVSEMSSFSKVTQMISESIAPVTTCRTETSTSYSCPAGTSDTGSACVYTITLPTEYSCPAGSAASSAGCTRTTSTQVQSCPAGYTDTGSACVTNATVPATPATMAAPDRVPTKSPLSTGAGGFGASMKAEKRERLLFFLLLISVFVCVQLVVLLVKGGEACETLLSLMAAERERETQYFSLTVKEDEAEEEEWFYAERRDEGGVKGEKQKEGCVSVDS